MMYTGTNLPTAETRTERICGTILVVDDTAMNIRLLQAMLSQHGHTIVGAHSGSEALAYVAEHKPDIILLDYLMEDMNGVQVCAALKADDCTRDIPVIFISAMDDTQTKRDAFAAGGVDYISKPFQFDEVLARINTHLLLYYRTREAEAAQAQLKQALQDQAQRNHQLQLLYKLSTALPRARSVTDLWQLALPFIYELVPAHAAMLYLYDQARNQLVLTEQWGSVSTTVRNFTPDTCWAWAGPRVHIAAGQNDKLICPHCVTDNPGPTLCIQLGTNHSLSGLLHLRITPPESGICPNCERTAMMIGDLLTMGLASLHTCASAPLCTHARVPAFGELIPVRSPLCGQ